MYDTGNKKVGLIEGRQGCRPLQQIDTKKQRWEGVEGLPYNRLLQNQLCLEKTNLFDMKKHYSFMEKTTRCHF